MKPNPDSIKNDNMADLEETKEELRTNTILKLEKELEDLRLKIINCDTMNEFFRIRESLKQHKGR